MQMYIALAESFIAEWLTRAPPRPGWAERGRTRRCFPARQTRQLCLSWSWRSPWKAARFDAHCDTGWTPQLAARVHATRGRSLPLVVRGPPCFSMLDDKAPGAATCALLSSLRAVFLQWQRSSSLSLKQCSKALLVQCRCRR